MVKSGIRCGVHAMDEGFSKMVIMREYLSGWAEAKPLRNADRKSVVAFIYEWITRFRIPGGIIHGNGRENLKITKELIERYPIRNVSISYRPRANGLIERGHQQLVDALAKLGRQWVLSTVGRQNHHPGINRIHTIQTSIRPRLCTTSGIYSSQLGDNQLASGSISRGLVSKSPAAISHT